MEADADFVAYKSGCASNFKAQSVRHRPVVLISLTVMPKGMLPTAGVFIVVCLLTCFEHANANVLASRQAADNMVSIIDTNNFWLVVLT